MSWEREDRTLPREPTSDEQRATSWMPYASLEDAMDPTDPSKTKEGHPAPRRVVLRGTFKD